VAETAKKPGFVQSLFSGVINRDLLTVYPSYGGEERGEIQAILDMVTRFARDRIDPIKIDREHHIPDSVKSGMKELGLWGLIIPEEYGGFAQSDFTYNKVTEILTGACGSTGVMYGGHLSIGLKAILLFGTEEQKKRFLPPLASGDKIAAFALTEPGAGSDAAAVRTTAELSPDGKYYVLNGRKQWITNGGFAEVFTVLALVRRQGEEPDSSQLTAFIVTRGMDGFSPGKEEDKLGIRGSSTTPLYLENVRVPVGNVLGGIGGGFKIFMEVLNTGRLSLGAGCIGAAKALMPHAVKHALQREQFRKPVAEFEMIREKFARMAINTFTAESMVYFTTCMKNAAPVSIAVESAICKAFASESTWQTVNDCLQVAGGNGFMRDYPYERFLRDTRINMIFEGTNEIQRMFIAVSGLRQLSVRLKKYQKELSGDPPVRERQIQEIYERIAPGKEGGVFDGFSDELQEQVAAAGRCVRRLNETAVTFLLRYGRAMKEMQFIQRRLADAAIDLYGMFANSARVENLLRNNHPTAGDALAVAAAFSRQAEKRIMLNLEEVAANRDDDLTRIAGMVYAAEKYPFEILDY